ncbi:hypothetical protein DRE_02739 [Drechslerella stenobrocha 248]|uniref:Uncharacterized protein n=1 Tax=Drechslerella stenobrocha 248 TaxID=1043628 RepID=W7I5V7_9PEZI|nr:hypothetical protein DRE_02739 [Drechslerella stenobrocha 248]
MGKEKVVFAPVEIPRGTKDRESESKEKNLATVKQEELDRMTYPGNDDLKKAGAMIMSITAEIKGTVLFQYRWEDLLMAAPVAISCMGGCFVAASSRRAATTTLKPFEYMKTKARGMQPSKETSPGTLQGALVECSNLGRWAFLEAKMSMGMISTLSVQMVKTACAAANRQIVSCLDQNGPALMLKARMNMLKKSANKCRDSALLIDARFEEWLYYVCMFHVACVEQQSATQAKELQNQLDQKSTEIKKTAAQKNVNAANEAVKMYKGQVKEAQEEYKKAMDSFPSGWDDRTAEGIDWAQVAAAPDVKTGMRFAHSMITSTQRSFNPPPPMGEATSKLMNVLNTVVRVAQEIEDAGVQEPHPDKADAKVRKWQDDFNIEYNIAFAMQAEARRLPGNPINPTPVLGQMQEKLQEGQGGGGKKGAGQAMMENARSRADSANQGLKEANERHMQSNKMLAESESALGEIKAHMAQLKDEGLTLEEIKEVLAKSIALIVKMKDQIEKLVTFFNSVSTTISAAVETVVEQFLGDAEMAGDLKEAGLQLDDFTRSAIFRGALTIRAYFSIFRDVAVLWMHISDTLQEGLRTCEEVGLLSTKEKDPNGDDRSSTIKGGGSSWTGSVDVDMLAVAQLAQLAIGKHRINTHSLISLSV